MVRSTLKLNAAISDLKIGGLRSMLAEDQKWGVPDDNGAKHSKAKWCKILMLAKVQKWGGPGSIITKTWCEAL